IASTRDDIAIATHGRSLYIMYDVAPLRQMAATHARLADVTLLGPPSAERGVDNGASIYYCLPDSAQHVKIEVLDGQGNLIRDFEASAADTAREGSRPGGGRFGGGSTRPARAPGLNRFTWDLRYPGFTSFP